MKILTFAGKHVDRIEFTVLIFSYCRLAVLALHEFIKNILSARKIKKRELRIITGEITNLPWKKPK